MIAKTTVLALMFTMATSCTRANASETGRIPSGRVYSTLGFSFLPPPGNDWTEEFRKGTIIYSKKTDPRYVSFYAGAVEVQLDAPMQNKAALTAFVKAKKDEWGTDGRYGNVSSSFLADPQQGSCVRYRMRANDRGANNPGNHEFLLLHVVGRFCTHPQNPRIAVDIFYSVRHVRDFDVKALSADGDVFLASLAFYKPAIANNGR